MNVKWISRGTARDNPARVTIRIVGLGVLLATWPPGSGFAQDLQPLEEVRLEETLSGEAQLAAEEPTGDEEVATDSELEEYVHATIEGAGPASGVLEAHEIEELQDLDRIRPLEVVVTQWISVIPLGFCVAPGMAKMLELHGRAVTGSSRLHVSRAWYEPGGDIYNFLTRRFDRIRTDGRWSPAGEGPGPSPTPVVEPIPVVEPHVIGERLILDDLAFAVRGIFTVPTKLSPRVPHWLLDLIGDYAPPAGSGAGFQRVAPPPGSPAVALIPTAANPRRAIGEGCLVLGKPCQWDHKRVRLKRERGILSQYRVAAGYQFPRDEREAEMLIDRAFGTSAVRGGLPVTVPVYSTSTGRPVGFWGGRTGMSDAFAFGVFLIKGRPVAVQTTASGIFHDYLNTWFAMPAAAPIRTPPDGPVAAVGDPVPSGP